MGETDREARDLFARLPPEQRRALLVLMRAAVNAPRCGEASERSPGPSDRPA